jgi:hypothetical protein
MEASEEQVQIATDMTHLTSLNICTTQQSTTGSPLAIAAHNPGLQSYSWHNWPADCTIQADAWTLMLTSCSSLCTLCLYGIILDDSGVAALLTYGTSITTLDLGTTALTTSKQDWPCKWQRLTVEGDLQELAYLPLKSVQHLQIRCTQGPNHQQEHLHLPNNILPMQLSAVLHLATSNLALCPARRSAPPSCLKLSGGATSTRLPQGALQSLTPLAAWRITDLQLDLVTVLDSHEMDAIADTCAASLTSLSVNGANVDTGFFVSLAARYLQLQKLDLRRGITSIDVDELTWWLSTHRKDSPRTLDLQVSRHCRYSGDLEYAIQELDLTNTSLTLY